ncbi:TetR/AcrR family transcriptional regulator [Nocardia sp. alder85J]|uniref:TetR/AcrR family transcriptional regulator n=1 Tax=Nocardia sp. alder85J TaxID=2862949 RepID=UPI001CD56A48|nr:TetR/AcrR family transcriptional regulator [Nocardia sp. alder85J]MCX4091539.1 helix-turn-helix domain containing protein [Nocardia sp. alder85J]
MGNREDLLAGARKAILERGLAKVTARDIATAAGVSLAAIGYHFGSKDRLITEAVLEVMGTGIGDDFEAAIRQGAAGRSPAESVVPTMDGLVAILAKNRDQLALAMENGMVTARTPETQLMMAEATEHACADLAITLRESFPDLAEDDARAVAKFYFTIFQGVALLWLLAPTTSLLTGAELARAIRVLR